MGTKIQDIVVVNANLAAPAVSQVGFGTPLIMAELTEFSDRVKTYTDLDGMTDDGFTVGDAAYDSAVDLLSQDTRPESFKVGRVAVNQNAKVSVVFDADASAGTFTISVSKEGGTAQTTAAIAYNATVGDVETALELLTNVDSVTVALNSGATVITHAEGFNVEFNGADANTHFAITAVGIGSLTSVTSSTITQTQYGFAADASWVAALTAIRAADDDWYNLIPVTGDKATILALAAVVEALTNKWMLVTSHDADVLTNGAGNVAATLKASNYKKTALAYHSKSSEYLEAAWSGRCTPETPGTINWAYTVLSSVTPDTLSSTELANLATNNVNRFETVGGYNIIPGTTAAVNGTTGGIMCSGLPIKVRTGVDQLVTRIQERFVKFLVDREDVTFTLDDWAAIESLIYEQCAQYGTDLNFLIPGTVVVTMPDFATYSSTNRAAGLFDGASVTAYIAYSINKIKLEINFV